MTKQTNPAPGIAPADLTGPVPAGPGAARPDRPGARPGLPPDRRKETGGPAGPEPTRYGDWERKGRCIDF